MTKEAFIQEMLTNLREHRKRRPAMQAQDAVKFVFQGMLGVGHLLSSREHTAGYIASETEPLQADSREPLFEALSPGWCRLNLRRAMAEKLSPDLIAGMMTASRSPAAFTRDDVQAVCRSRELSGITGSPEAGYTDRIPDENFLPSHSPEYRVAYRPAYRVVSADWIRYIDMIRQISGKQSAGRLLVTIDGPCASGKTTFAARLADVFQAPVVHTDDYVIPHDQKTAERLVREVVKPWKQGETVQYRKYDCAEDALLPPQTLPRGEILILEGSYCNLPPVREYADVRMFLDAPWETRKARLEKRESPDSLKRFYDRWIPLEDAYFAAFHLPDAGCVICR